MPRRPVASSAPLTPAQQQWADEARAAKRAQRQAREQARRDLAAYLAASRRPARTGEVAALVIDVPDGLWMTSNHRPHHMTKARKTAGLRPLARDESVRQQLPRFERAHVTAHIGYPTRRKADPGNAELTVKALLDGLSDGGVWEDDDSSRVVGPDYRRDPELSARGVHRVTLEIIALTPHVADDEQAIRELDEANGRRQWVAPPGGGYAATPRPGQPTDPPARVPTNPAPTTRKDTP